jgi:exo-1,4-beta-D-glucosaminidase
MDQAGIMIDSGLQCCDAWGNNLSGTLLTVATNSALAIGQDEVDHPSVVTFSWSDNAPGSADAKDTLSAFAQADFDVPVVASAEENSVSAARRIRREGGPVRLGPAGLLVRHHAQPARRQPDQRGRFLGLRQRAERGRHDPDPRLDQPLPVPHRAERTLAVPTYNQYHANYETGHGDYEFGTLYYFDQAMDSRYGTPTSLNQYVEEGQLQNYENTRAQFEAFLDHSDELRRHPVHRHDLLAAQQGLALAALEPLQRGRRPGRQLLRRQGGQPERCTRSTRRTTAP